jgi:DNA adenine methylase
VYLDPPYRGTQGYGFEFGIDQYARMAELMRAMKGKAVLSVNDHPEMRRVFAGFDTQRVGICYTIGSPQNKRRETGELIIRSW